MDYAHEEKNGEYWLSDSMKQKDWSLFMTFATEGLNAYN